MLDDFFSPASTDTPYGGMVYAKTLGYTCRHRVIGGANIGLPPRQRVSSHSAFVQLYVTPSWANSELPYALEPC